MGLCAKCDGYMTANNAVPVDLFLRHVYQVLDFIRVKHPALRAIMWDDMFRGIDLLVLQGQKLTNFLHTDTSPTAKLEV